MLSRILFVIASLILQSHSFAAGKCVNQFSDNLPQIESLLVEPYNVYEYMTYRAYTKLSPKLRRTTVLNASAVGQLFLDKENPDYILRLKSILETLKNESSLSNKKIISAFREFLTDKVPNDQIETRLAGLKTGTLKGLRQALGEMKIDDVQKLMYGSNPLNPSSDSLLGKYISRTGATAVEKSFSLGPEHGQEVGETRLVVAVSEQTIEEFKKLFSNANLLMHVHTPQQGTLMVSHRGRINTYGALYTDIKLYKDIVKWTEQAGIAQHRNPETLDQLITENRAHLENQAFNSQFRTPQIGTIIPTILLSSSEGNRAFNFFKLASVDRDNALLPWENIGQNYTTYCAMGGYNSCTHWIGNIPIGDRKVKIYEFPGKVDDEADNDVGRGVQRQALVKLSTNDSLANIVWQAPGYQQLSHVIGLKKQNNRGEMASPGYVAVSLTAQTPVERVPVVFLVVENHRQPIDVNFDPQINAH